jgi:hypothetical protein
MPFFQGSLQDICICGILKYMWDPKVGFVQSSKEREAVTGIILQL